ncbi:MAG: response regulator [Proteobacteria bacterium]|nr:response regulator [Pseudomonadota bacterium]
MLHRKNTIRTVSDGKGEVEAGPMLTTLLKSLPIPVIAIDSNEKVIIWNPSATRFFKWNEDEVLGQTNPIIPSDDSGGLKDALRFVFKGNDFADREAKCKKKDDSLVDVKVSASPILDSSNTVTGIQMAFVDLSDRKQAEYERYRLEEKLRQSQKMEAIGTLSGGVVHDFNNLLYAILGYAELAIEDTKKESMVYNNLEQIVKAGKRAANLTSQILTFSRNTKPEKRPIQLQSVVTESLNLLRSTLPDTIEIQTNLDEKCGAVLADPTQINQLIINLGTNAYHAMRERGGVLGVRLEELKIHPEMPQKYHNLTIGRYVKLTIRDSGHGMDVETIDHIFEPFFTTKKQGEGTGLGLATVYEIVKSYNGTITVQSEPGGGTIFEILFPMLAHEIKSIKKVDDEMQLLKGFGRILYVDDEELIARLGKRILTRLGYDVTALSSSTEALQVFCINPSSFDIVIADHSMPDLTGTELAKHLCQIRPDIPIVLATGCSEAIDQSQAQSNGIREYLKKPIGIYDLAKTVRRVIEQH